MGLGNVQQGTISEQSWHFEPPEGRELFEEWASSYAEFDPEQANALLDEAGLERDGSGRRVRADNGEPFQMLIDVGGWGGPEINAEASALLKRHWEQNLGIQVVLNQAPDSEIGQRWDLGGIHGAPGSHRGDGPLGFSRLDLPNR